MIHRICAVLAIVLGLGAAAPQPAVSKPSFFVLIYEPGPQWKPGVPMAHQGLRAHFGYMMSLRNAHKLFVAGPLDADSGLILLRAQNLDEAKDVMAHDPAILAEIFKGTAHRWRDAVDSGDTAAAFLDRPQ